MKAIGQLAFGGPEVLQVVEVPAPHPGPGEIRIRVHAGALSRGDLSMRAGEYPIPDARPPYILGMESAGIIDEIGPGTDTLHGIGDTVMTPVLPNSPHGGGHAQYIVVPATWPVRAPSNISLSAASAIPMTGLTAQHALDLLALSPGQTVAISGAAGAVGRFAVQLARASGMQVIADAAPRDVELVRSLGADVVVQRDHDFGTQVRECLPDGVDGLIDGADLGVPALFAVRDGGAVALLRGDHLGAARETVFRREVFAPLYYGGDKLDRLREQFERGTLAVQLARTFRPIDAPEAHRQLEAGGLHGRIVFEFDPSHGLDRQQPGRVDG